jgi:hypothetical protein
VPQFDDLAAPERKGEVFYNLMMPSPARVPKQRLVCEAPDDVTVAKLDLLRGRVTAGQLLATLSSPRLDWLQARHDAAVAELDIRRRAFTEHRVDDLKKVLAAEVTSALAAAKASQKLLKIGQRLVDTGTLIPSELDSLKEHVAETNMKLSDAVCDQVRSEGRFNDLQARLGIDGDRLQKEATILNDLRQRLSVKAPADGEFVASVGPGGFVLAGDPVGIVFLKEPPSTQQLRCAAPDDVVVSEIHVSGGRVVAGQSLAMLSSARLARFRASLDAVAAGLDVKQRPFQDGRVKKIQDALAEKNAASGEASEAANHIVKVIERKFKLGHATVTDLCAPGARAAAARAELVSAKINIEQFPLKLRDLKDRIANGRAHLARENAIFDSLSKTMSLAAPTAGVFTASAGKGSFVQAGDPIGVLYV